MVKDVILGCKVTIVYLEETKLTNPKSAVLIDLGLGHCWEWRYLNMMGASGGIIIVVKQTLYNLSED